ncbi:hypothetical protein Q4488_04825 [Amphritea sp. 1_MG-2023]|uniref:hypothetical protein n=1 Tax=Amphritea sp. 1_MG-2023 TaxID=3062670 RepID=UPI0026E38F18|nr:hypothetical protein [Amphritea sp. 1_MG-2023]MDO6562701.1 hypothetical protein [Amphritea sp. 1_MG-2023]
MKHAVSINSSYSAQRTINIGFAFLLLLTLMHSHVLTLEPLSEQQLSANETHVEQMLQPMVSGDDDQPSYVVVSVTHYQWLTAATVLADKQYHHLLPSRWMVPSTRAPPIFS